MGQLGPPQADLEPSWGHPGAMPGSPGAILGHLGPSWAILGSSWADFGLNLGHLGTVWTPKTMKNKRNSYVFLKNQLLDACWWAWGLQGPSRAHLGASWGHLGAILGRPGPIWRPSWGNPGDLGPTLAAPGPPQDGAKTDPGATKPAQVRPRRAILCGLGPAWAPSGRPGAILGLSRGHVGLSWRSVSYTHLTLPTKRIV